MAIQDNFTSGSDKYAGFRPGYPGEFFEYLDSLLVKKENAWDCGTGNGQVARERSKTFNQVFATGISASQINHAFQAENIRYSLQPAEQTDFEEETFYLIVAAQAVHWFNFAQFYTEVRRTARKGALLCLLGYGLNKISTAIDQLITGFYTALIGPY